MKKQIPNIITSLNILCGCVAVLFAVSGDLITASFFVFSGIFFDFFDGLAARLLKAQSEIGLQLDSLADVITSGVAPGVVLFQLLNLSIFGSMQTLTETFSTEGWNLGFKNYLPLIGLLVIVASAYRLAKFNVDTRQTSSFIGLPTPANAILILSLPLILQFQYSEIAETIILNKWFLFVLTGISCFLLNAEVPLFALKFKTWDFKNNALRYIFILLSVLLIVLLKYVAIPLIIVLYILLSLFWKEKPKNSY
ncbi:CDP-alcohol phosphatidyltransferase family protein [Aequorivita echinoideorum]|uniref:CDP-alcohol phosphatidyltransferase family protein n=1 Tax=Aequorivita echinoideorum TaxID=1549647 RepID=A0ABS5S7S9_9FLAO|nr:CDP-alcohol phosphatidyltransferase family protein [Aequorivita echinoideorum]MBT0608474.1 CDP-alcohol phosphatidyltransferase family protein [Aequorivita echinoideorum]